MKPGLVAALLLFLVSGPVMALAAEEDTGATPVSGPVTSSNSFVRGDQTVSLGLGLQSGLMIYNPNTRETESAQLNTGAAGSVEYQYFLSSGFAIGGTVAGSFNQSIGGNSFFLAPLTFRTAYWWKLSSFEIGAAAELGGYLMSYRSNTFWGPAAKLGAEAMWRINNAWGIGVRCDYWLIPEIHTSDSSLNRFGNFLETGLVASYHI
jgi:hypothetical protein